MRAIAASTKLVVGDCKGESMTADRHGIHGKHCAVGSTPCGATGLSPHPAMIELARLLARLLAMEAAVAQPAAPAKRAANIAGPSSDIPIAPGLNEERDGGR